LFAVIAATILRTFFIEAYTIPTPSMEKSLMVGDYLFVDKTAYGPRVPMTPLSFPLVHHTLPLIGGQSYLEWLKFDYHRMSGWRKGNENSPIGVERNDCVVFNWPAERLGRPIDKKENYVKRCVALPGDELKIEGGILFINGKEEEKYPIKENQVKKNKQRRYFAKIKPKVLAKYLLCLFFFT
jgi:signal peptidase I